MAIRAETQQLERDGGPGGQVEVSLPFLAQQCLEACFRVAHLRQIDERQWDFTRRLNRLERNVIRPLPGLEARSENIVARRDVVQTLSQNLRVELSLDAPGSSHGEPCGASGVE